MKRLYIPFILGMLHISCSDKLALVRQDAIKPAVVTAAVPHDTDDPAIWINPAEASKSLVIGTDKDTDGGLYLYDLQGNIVKKSISLKRPNNVDIAYGLMVNGKKTDIAVTTERETNRIRIFSLPNLEPIDNGGIEVFAGEAERSPMGVALYTRPTDGKIFAIVGRKFGPKEGYLWQYELWDGGGVVTGKVVRKFGKFSQKKEIEAIAVDNELGYAYYCDENIGIRKYMADPAAGNDNELALFGSKDFKEDHEGIAIYKNGKGTGYLLISNQQANTFMVYAREGSTSNPHSHTLLAEIPVSTIECDGADATPLDLGGRFSNGMLAAMSNGMVFHFYSWDDIQPLIDAGKK